MLKLEKRQILKNVGSSWFALAINVMVGIFLSPFILHHLGDAAFGIWVLIFSVTGYYGLFDLGIRSSIIRYVSKYTATGDREKLTQFVNTALFTYTGIGVVSMALTALLSSSVEHLFRIPPGMHSQARLLLLMVGASVSLGFPLGVFGGMLEGLQRFYIYIAGNRACAFLILPITAILILLGRHILRIWVGARYVPHSYPVLVVMIIPFALMMSQAASARVLFGLCKHQTIAVITLIEGIANVILSIALVPPLGIVGDALGTAIPLSFTCIVFLPRHLKKQIGVPVGIFLREAYTLPTSLDPPAGRSALARQPILLSPHPDPVGARNRGGEFDLRGRPALGLSHQPSVSRRQDCGLDSAVDSRATAAGGGFGGISE
ncbi:MAG TPA: polysaccharide biosynthesis C-terminal domain-containing protein [Terriglobales bacterium]|nr:polysaccharide biosynthesis C-terminal domain-containing protein [Terriglobales bacterium]